MTWFDYTLVSSFVLSASITASQVGKPRDPVTPSLAACSVILNFLFALGVIFVR